MATTLYYSDRIVQDFQSLTLVVTRMIFTIQKELIGLADDLGTRVKSTMVPTRLETRQGRDLE